MSAELFTPQVIAAIALVAAVAALLAFLMTYILVSKRATKLQSENEQICTELSSLKLEKARVESVHLDLNKRFHELDVLHSKISAQHEISSKQLEGTEGKLREAAANLDAIREEKHAAEKGREATQSELTEARIYQQKLEKGIADTNKESKEKLDNLQNKYDALQEKHSSLAAEHAELKTTLDEREKGYEKQLAQLNEHKQVLTKEFENLANKIFEEKGKTFTDTSKASIDIMLQPFREQIDGFQKRVNDIHDESIKGNAGLNSEIKRVLEIGLKMSDEASSLTSALKGDSQQRGAWGEAQLERTLEMSGLIENDHYEAQSPFKDQDGKRKQTDYLIKLPDNKHIIIDSKVSLVAYDAAISAATPEEHKLAMDEHLKAIRKHINDLADKDYTNLVGIRSPSFVLMFMPIEPAYIDALKANKDLFSYGYAKGVVLVSHTTLIPILRTVSNLWMMEKSNAEAREISEKAGDIYNQVCTVAERLLKLGNTLGTASNHYNLAITALAGQQGLYGKVERFNQLSSKVSKTLPALEPKHMDFETERLALAAEPILELEEGEIKGADDSEEETPKAIQQLDAVEETE